MFRLRTTQDAGVDTLVTPPESVQTRIMHVVMTRAATGQMRAYVDGRVLAEAQVGGDFSVWARDFSLALGDEIRDGQRAWLGTYYLVAIYDRALEADEIKAKLRLGHARSLTRPGWQE